MSWPSFHWIWSTTLRLRSGFAPPSGSPHLLRIESAMAQYGRQLTSRRVLVSPRSVLFWKVTGCCLLFRCFTSCLLRAKFSLIAASCSGISFSLLSPTARYMFKFLGAWLWTEHIQSWKRREFVNLGLKHLSMKIFLFWLHFSPKTKWCTFKQK